MRRTPVVQALLVCAGSIAVAAPAHAKAPSYGKILGDTLTATVKKQLDPKTSSLGGAKGSDPLTSTLRQIGSILTGAPATVCKDEAPASKPFTQWNDKANYVPVPNSGFENGLATWQPLGRVSLAADNHAFDISGRTGDTTSAVLPEGSSLASASFCGGVQYPTLRLMTRSLSGKSARALVTVRYTGRDGLLAALPLGTVSAGPQWGPSEIVLTGSGVPLFTGTSLGLTITSTSGTIAIDDVYVDPYRRA